MKIKLSKSQWEFVGKKAGWMKKAFKMPGSQNTDPSQTDFAVALESQGKTIPQSIRKRINKEIHGLGSYFVQIPIDRIDEILQRNNVVMLQEDGTRWSGYVTTQGECGDVKSGPMQFDLAWKLNDEYILSNNYLIMTACTMPSGKIEVVAYVS